MDSISSKAAEYAEYIFSPSSSKRQSRKEAPVVETVAEEDSSAGGASKKSSASSVRRSKRNQLKKQREAEAARDKMEVEFHINEERDSEDDEQLTDYEGSEPSNMDPPSESEEEEEPMMISLSINHCRAETDTQTIQGKKKVVCGRLASYCQKHATASSRHPPGTYEGIKASKLSRGEILFHGIIGSNGTKTHSEDESEDRRTLKHVEVSDGEDSDAANYAVLKAELEALDAKRAAKKNKSKTKNVTKNVAFTGGDEACSEPSPRQDAPQPRNLALELEGRAQKQPKKAATKKKEPESARTTAGRVESDSPATKSDTNSTTVPRVSVETIPEDQQPALAKMMFGMLDSWLADRGVQPGTLATKSPSEGETVPTPDKTYSSTSKLTVISDNEESEEDRSNQRKKPKKSRSSKDRRRSKQGRSKGHKQRRASRSGGDPYDSPSSSSSSESSEDSSSRSSYDSHLDSNSEQDSSDSSISYKRRSRRSAKKRSPRSNSRFKKRHSRKKRENKRTTSKRFPTQDESVGDKKKVYGHRLMSQKLDELLSPEGMKLKDAQQLPDVLGDAVGLPGMYGAMADGDGGDNRAEEILERMAENLRSEESKSMLKDIGFKNATRNVIYKISDADELKSTIEDINDVSDSFFSNQDLLVTKYMQERNYTQADIDDYLHQGTYIKIVRDTHQFYLRLLHTVRELYYEYTHNFNSRWKGSPAQVLLKYHAGKLRLIRTQALTKKFLIIQNYIYLRDANEKDFTNSATNKAVMTSIAELKEETRRLNQQMQEVKTTGGPKDKTVKREGETTCKHCRSLAIHNKLQLKHDVSVCPFEKLKIGAAKSQRIKGSILKTFDDKDNKKTLLELIEEHNLNVQHQAIHELQRLLSPPNDIKRYFKLTTYLFVFLSSLLLPGEHLPEVELNSELATGVEVRKVELGNNKELKTIGIIGGGCEIMRYAWPRLELRFSIRNNGDTVPNDLEDPPLVLLGPHRLRKNLLVENPVDVLVVERGEYRKASSTIKSELWEDLIVDLPNESTPKIVIEAWRSDAHVWKHGPMSKPTVTRWTKLGYQSHCRFVNATSVGGAVNQERALIVRTLKATESTWEWDKWDQNLSVIRPMSNLLTPPGLVPRRLYLRGKGNKMTPKWNKDPMPPRVGSLVETEKGIRGLTIDEVARGLGIPKGTEANLSARSVNRSTSLFHWEYLSRSLQLFGNTGHNHSKIASTTSTPDSALAPIQESEEGAESEPFEWVPPDLSPGGTWFKLHTASLWKAASTYPNPDEIYQDGMDRLTIHRANYTSEGPDPKRLQLLWWEFPPEHWEELRLGARQNFLCLPQSIIRPNAPMDNEMTIAASEFVDELLELGVLRTLEEGRMVLANAPLFVVPKEGQPGQWRVIADMLRGGQNECVGQDPVFMPRISQIIEELYTGGYSAVVDLSKFFYNFPTHSDDQPYLGLLHPTTGQLVAYYGLAMGAGNSPAVACRLGLAFVRLVKEKFDEFQGKGRANCYWTGLRDNGYDPKLGYGFILTAEDGGAVLIWAWVDDFLIHGPTKAKTTRALQLFLDTAVDCGFLFHPKKLVPPQQVVKYCGFLFDTTTVPCLRLPEAKKERAHAICEYLVNSPIDKKWSRLSLAVAAGVLESLSEATPRRLGHTHLREFHSLVHPPGLGTGAEPYYTTTTMTRPVIEELRWWIGYFTKGKGRHVRMNKSATLVPTFGDGSGTGTGGTIHLPGCPFEMWRGKWKPSVYKFPSVWKELATLKETLLRILESPHAASVAGTTIFYFTDNTGVYWIGTMGSSSSPQLHRLLGEIRLLELELDCMLVVVHVPGLVLITQGTDGLSRGVWMTPFHSTMDPNRLTQAIFDPLPYDPGLVWQHFPHLAHWGQPWHHVSWNQPWKASMCLDKTTIWFPPPELARQLLTFILNSWVERPYTTSAILFIPRVLEGMWRNLSRFVYEITVIYPHKTPLNRPPLLPIPIVVLCIFPHQRLLNPNSRLDRPSRPAPAWHKAEAALMRGLPPRIQEE